ncbi:hypothetical protein KAU11_12310, partial [Candidatus Babeliales bacterium]|nr:hypothetical protein [Candidatus Babeliales bacterium]
KRQQILDNASDLGLKILNPPARIEEVGDMLEEAMLEEEYELLDEEIDDELDEFEFDEESESEELDESEENSSK